MEKNTLNVWLIGLIVLLMIINLFGFMSITPEKLDQDALANKVTAQVIGQIDIPTASEIAAEIPPVVIPEIVVPEPKELNNNRIDDLWKDLYGEEIDELEANALDVAEIELEDDDYDLLVKYLEANIEGFDELMDVDVEDTEVAVISLGLEEDEDKTAEVVFELEIEYTLIEGVVQDYKKQIIVTANVVFEEGDFNDEEVELVFA